MLKKTLWIALIALVVFAPTVADAGDWKLRGRVIDVLPTDESDAVDARMFIQRVTPLRATRATRFDATTFYGVAGGTTITFEVEFRNDFQRAQTHVQIFRAYIEVFDTASTTVLDRRNVYVVVPPIGGILI